MLCDIMIYVIVGIENTLAFLNCTENIFLGTAVVMLPAHSSLSGADLVNIYISTVFGQSRGKRTSLFPSILVLCQFNFIFIITLVN